MVYLTKTLSCTLFKEQTQFIYQIMDNEGLIEGHINIFTIPLFFEKKIAFLAKMKKLCHEGFFKK